MRPGWWWGLRHSIPSRIPIQFFAPLAPRRVCLEDVLGSSSFCTSSR